jgi:phage tail sheath protein FI
MAYLHGIETITYKTGLRPVVEVKTAIVGLVGTAPPELVPPFELTIFAGESDAQDKLGDPQDGYTVYNALKAIFDHENTLVLFVNAYDPDVSDLGSIPDESIVKAFGEFDKALFKYGFTPKILIAPEYSVRPAVAVEMASRAKKYRGIAYADLPNDIDFNEILAYKQDNNLADTHLVLCYPKVKTLDGENWLSSRLAGLTVWVDKNAPESYGAVPSGRRIEGITGITKDLTYLPNDPDSDVQRINAQGVYTVRPFLGSLVGFGVRTAAFPSLTHPADTLINWVRVSGIVEETLEYALLQFLDKIAFYSPEAPLEPVVKDIQSTIDDYLRTLEMRGILIYKSVRLDVERTTLTELLQGRIHYEYEPIPGIPIEGIVLHKVMNSDRVAEVFQQVAQTLA